MGKKPSRSYATMSLDVLRAELQACEAGIRELEGQRDKMAGYHRSRKAARAAKLRAAIAVRAEKEAAGRVVIQVAPQTDKPGMELVCAVTLSSVSLAEVLGLPTSTVPRGTRIPVEALARCRNGDALLRTNMLRWMPPSAPRPTVAAAPPREAEPVRPPDFIGDVRERMLRHVRAGRSWSEAEDLVIATDEGADVYKRAQKQFADTLGRGWPGQHSTAGFRAHIQSGGP